MAKDSGVMRSFSFSTASLVLSVLFFPFSTISIGNYNEMRSRVNPFARAERSHRAFLPCARFTNLAHLFLHGIIEMRETAMSAFSCDI